MIELHQYPTIWGLSSLSPFCIKVEVFLRRCGIPYVTVVERNPLRGPKGKMPFIKDGGRIIADSTFIIEHLIRTHGLQEVAAKDPILRAQGLAFQRMIEEYLYFILLYSRWIDEKGWAVIKREFGPLFPPLLGVPVLSLIRRRLRAQATAQGLGRHSSAEIYAIGQRDLAAISAYLGDKPFLLGAQWSEFDATLFAFLVTILKQPIASELQGALLGMPNLVAYCEREEICLGSL